MSRLFRVEEAERLLPEVAKAIEEAIQLKKEYQDAEGELHREAQRITMSGGASVDRDSIALARARKNGSAEGLKGAIEKIHSFGCFVKDLDMGLIDFPTRYHGKEVLLCWKLGEPAIEWWHDTEAGFRGRKPIDDEFRANHEGDLTV